jgi:hypothetical protein
VWHLAVWIRPIMMRIRRHQLLFGLHEGCGRRMTDVVV